MCARIISVPSSSSIIFKMHCRRITATKYRSSFSIPLLARLHDKNIKIRTKRELLANFDAIFDKGARCVVTRAKDKDVWGNSRGFTVGGGAVWFDDFSPPGTNDDVKAPDFWTKGTFLIMTVNNEAFYDCKAG